jgi:hypothetical protein
MLEKSRTQTRRSASRAPAPSPFRRCPQVTFADAPANAPVSAYE